MHVCDTTYIPSIHLYAYIYIYIYTQIDCIHTYSSCIMRTRAHSAKCYQRLIYRYLSLYRYTQKQVCFSPKGIQIYAASSHYHQMRRKGLWQHPPPCHVHSYMQTHEKGNALGHGHTEREGNVQKLQGLICNCFKKKKIKTLQLKCLCNIGSSVHLNRFLKPPGSASLEVKLYEQITARFYFSPAWTL